MSNELKVVREEAQCLIQAAFPGHLVKLDKDGSMWLSGFIRSAMSLSAGIQSTVTQENIEVLGNHAKENGSLEGFSRAAVACGFTAPQVAALAGDSLLGNSLSAQEYNAGVDAALRLLFSSPYIAEHCKKGVEGMLGQLRR